MEDSLHYLHNRGNMLKGVFDSTNSVLPGGADPRMKGLPVENTWDPPANVFLDTIPGLIHHKYFIIDATAPDGNKITSTGSYNWELPAELYNDENSLTIFDARVNNLYFQEFHARYRESGGEIIQQSITEKEPSAFGFINAFPNPCQNSTTIKYETLIAGTVSLIIYDMQGRIRDVLVNEWQAPGKHELKWDAALLSTGLYFCRLTVSGEGILVKIIHGHEKN